MQPRRPAAVTVTTNGQASIVNAGVQVHVVVAVKVHVKVKVKVNVHVHVPTSEASA